MIGANEREAKGVAAAGRRAWHCHRHVPLAAALVAACGQPPLSLSFDVAQSGRDACVIDGSAATSCSQIPMPCRSVVSIRVVSADHPDIPYLSVCQELMGQPDLCAIAAVDLPEPADEIPDQTLEVDIAVYPLSAVETSSGLLCPDTIAFDDSGFPIAADAPCIGSASCSITPAIGGRAYYHPGDAHTVVHLGCVDLSQVDNAACTGGQTFAVTASVNDFDTATAVPSSLADELTVSVGQPMALAGPMGTTYQLDSASLYPLMRTGSAAVPAWDANVPAAFTMPCLDVLEDGPETTATLACRDVADPDASLDLVGWRLAKPTLDQVLAALGATAFPGAGLVVGLVIDSLGHPLAGQTVVAPGATISYLSADRSALSGQATSSSGIFVSTDAPFGASFEVASGVATAHALGGLVAGKVTVVVLQYDVEVGPE